MTRAFTLAQIGAALGISKKSVFLRAKREAWPFTESTGVGGTCRMYALQDLPVKVQAAVLRSSGEVAQTATSTADEGYDADALWSWAERKTDKQRAEGTRRAELLRQVQRLVDTGRTFREAADAVGTANNVSAANLRNWYYGVNGRSGARDYHVSDWPAALIPGFTGSAASAAFSEEAWEWFRADYLRLEQPAAKACYERLQQLAKEKGWSVPSLRTVERRIDTLPTPLRVLLREGESALLRLYPAIERSVRDLHALEWINGDGYQHNVFVKWPDGTIARPKTWFWQDVYSRRQLTWRTDTTEHTDVIRLSFGDLVERFGIPDHVTIDNTRAAANKWMTGGVANRYRFKVKPDDPLGLFPQLGVKVHWTSVIAGKGHGQAKPIERSFGVGGIGEYVDKHPAFAGAFTGNNPAAKPENYASRAVPLDEFLRVLNEGVATWNAMAKRRTEVCAGQLSYNEAFDQSYAIAPVRKATGEQRRLWMLTAEAVRVAHDGTITLDAGGAVGVGKNRYAVDALLEHIGARVVARFDPQQLHESVHVYSLDGRYIGEATCIQAAGWGDSQRSREHNKLRKQKMRAVKDQARAEQRMSALEAAKQLPAIAPQDPPESSVVRAVFKRTGTDDMPARATELDDDRQQAFNSAVGNLVERLRKGSL